MSVCPSVCQRFCLNLNLVFTVGFLIQMSHILGHVEDQSIRNYSMNCCTLRWRRNVFYSKPIQIMFCLTSKNVVKKKVHTGVQKTYICTYKILSLCFLLHRRVLVNNSRLDLKPKKKSNSWACNQRDLGLCVKVLFEEFWIIEHITRLNMHT